MTTRLVCTNLVFSLAKLLARACHGIRLPTRSESILGCSTAPSVRAGSYFVNRMELISISMI